jgi:hypothetical protein
MYVEKAKSPFFVRRSSTLKIPARPIIEPFWSAHKSQAMQNLRKNFRDAMKAKVLNA